MKVLQYLIIILTFIYNTAIGQDSIRVTELYPGIEYCHIVEASLPLNTHMLKIDLSNPYINIKVGIANDRIGFGGETASSFVQRNQNDSLVIVGAVNGDFFGGKPMSAENCMIVNGEFSKGVALERTLFGITRDKVPFVEQLIFDGKIIFKNDTVKIDALNSKSGSYSLSVFNKYYGNDVVIDDGYFAIKVKNGSEISPNKWVSTTIDEIYYNRNIISYGADESAFVISEEAINLFEDFDDDDTLKIWLGTLPFVSNIYSLIGGLPGLINNGNIPETYYGAEGLRSEGFLDTHPRTAVGFTQDKKTLFLVVIDGRQEKLSIGIGLNDLAAFMKKLGCYYAVNLDGGGSSTMVINNKVVNSPSDKSGERAVHNFLYVTYKKLN